MRQNGSASVVINLFLTVLAAFLLFCFALAVPSGTVLETEEEMQETEEESGENEYDFL